MAMPKPEKSPAAIDVAKVREIISSAADIVKPTGRKILAVIPDGTRTCPLPLLARELYHAIGRRAARFDFLIALGTHQPMNEARIDALLGVPPGQRAAVFGRSRVFNHKWDDPAALARVGVIPASRIREITGGLFAMDVDVTVNRLLLEYDAAIACGPVFPHEVVGFSGGSKYFFPGACGPELLNFFHWLGAVITSPRIIGEKNTPVRQTIETAADMLDMEKFALCPVLAGHELAGLFFGRLRDAWSAAADLSARVNIVRLARPFESVLSRAPEMYDDLWTGAKCMYKLEPVVADGGELIIFAPHITEISRTHGRLIEQIGYHTRDYFLSQWDRFKHYPWGVLAHSTHVRGIGSFENGLEKPRIRVTLATGITPEVCEKVNLGYRDPGTIDPANWTGCDDRLYVPKAGEMLYKLADPPQWQNWSK